VNIFFLLAILAQFADVATTKMALSCGHIESNPLYGSDPDLLVVLAIKLIVLNLLLTNIPGKDRSTVLVIFILMGTGAAVWNLNLIM